MKVAFWSNGRGKSCVTSNLACISVLSILSSHNQNKTILFENHQNIINLGSTLAGCQYGQEVKESGSYTVNHGLERVLRSVETGEQLPKETFFNFAEGYLGERLFYLPTGNISNSDILEYQMDRDCVPAMNYLEQYGEFVFVDTSSAPLSSSRKILQQADLVVVNLSQNTQMLTHFFRNYSLIREKAFYLIGNYDADSELTRSAIMKKYQIKGNRIGVIHHNVGFSDAVSEGNIIPFLLKHFRCGQQDENYGFMQAAMEAVELFHGSMKAMVKEG